MTKALQIKPGNQVSQTSSEQLAAAENAYRPATDIFHTPDEFIFVVDLPGVKQEDVQLEINERNTLILKANSCFEQSVNPVLRQARLGNFYRAFELGDNIDRNKVSARFELGVLEVRVAKKEQARPRKIEIQV